MHDLQWDDLRFFLGVVEAGSLVAAARRLDSTHTTVGRRLRELERVLGKDVFERLPNRLALTAFGQELLVRARAMREVANSVARFVAAQTSPSRAAVRITATSSVALFLSGHAAALVEACGRVEPSLAGSRDRLSLARREADIALRMRRLPEEGDLVARKIGRLAFALYAAPGSPCEVSVGLEKTGATDHSRPGSSAWPATAASRCAGRRQVAPRCRPRRNRRHALALLSRGRQFGASAAPPAAGRADRGRLPADPWGFTTFAGRNPRPRRADRPVSARGRRPGRRSVGRPTEMLIELAAREPHEFARRGREDAMGMPGRGPDRLEPLEAGVDDDGQSVADRCHAADPNPVAARTASASARATPPSQLRAVGKPAWLQRRSPATSAMTGRPPTMNTSDLTIAPSSQPTDGPRPRRCAPWSRARRSAQPIRRRRVPPARVAPTRWRERSCRDLVAHLRHVIAALHAPGGPHRVIPTADVRVSSRSTPCHS